MTRGRSGFFERIPPRPVKSSTERAVWVDSLRAIYSGSPEHWPAPHVDPDVSWKELGRIVEPPVSVADMPVEEKRLLGRILFFDPRLSRSGQMACASCHDPDLGWADGRATSFGTARLALPRNAPSIMNSAYARTLFWDGRADSLEDQAFQVLMNPNEMHSSPDLIVERLSEEPEYRELFKAAFGSEQIDIFRVSTALAAFERTIVGGRSRFDVFLSGKSEALSESALIGLDLFRREARCMNCHNGPLLTDGQFHDIGLSYFGRKQYEDLGRYETTRDNADTGKFRTPSLRNVTATRPYMHNGLFELEGVLNMYNAGMPTLVPKGEQQGDPRFPKKSSHLKPLGLNRQDIDDLQAFLQSLEEPRLRVRPPRLPGQPKPKGKTAAETAPETP